MLSFEATENVGHGECVGDAERMITAENCENGVCQINSRQSYVPLSSDAWDSSTVESGSNMHIYTAS